METARFGPFLGGYNAASPAHQIGRDELAEDSHDLYIDPFNGRAMRRKGTAFFPSSSAVLETGNSQTRGLHAIELYSPNLAQPTIAILWGEEIADTGTVGFYSWNGAGTNQQLLKSYGATHYPANMKVVPIFQPGYGWSRGVTSADRNHLTTGSRRMLQVADSLLLPSYLATPSIWNKDFNDASGSGTRNERLMPAGMIPPLAPPTLSAIGPTDENGSWQVGDTYYISQMFQDHAGNFSMPFIPRPPGTPNLVGGLGLETVPGSGAEHFAYLDRTIRKGPHGTKARWILRSPKVPQGQLPNLNDLRICGYVPNNTETTFRDFNGNDLGLVADPIAVRFDHAWLRPARYVWAGNERIWAAYLKPQSAAIILAPDQNLLDDDTGFSTTTYSVNITLGTSIVLKKTASTTTITLSSSKNTQQLVDEINATTDSGSNGGKWLAAVVPGSDASATSDQLFQTTSFDFGDAATGEARAYSNAYPFVAHFITGYLANTPDLKRTVTYTFGGPGAAPNAPKAWGATERNKKTIPEELGIIMGGFSLPGAQIVPCSRGVAAILNTRDSRTGLDEDFYIETINHSRGCIAFDSVVQGDGWGGYMTSEGFVVIAWDGGRLREVLITGKIWNPSTQRGLFAYEVTNSEAAVAADAEQATSNVWSQFHARIMGSRLYLTFQSAAGTYRVADKYVVYDFSPGVGGAGFAEILKPDGSPWPWSPPQGLPATMNVGTMAEIRTTSGVRKFAAQEPMGGNIGLIRELETGYLDGATAIADEGYCSKDFLGTTKRKQCHRITAIHKHSAASVAIGFSRDQARASSVSLSLPQGDTTDAFIRTVKELPQTARAGGEVAEISWGGNGAGSEQPEIHMFELEYEVSGQLR